MTRRPRGLIAVGIAIALLAGSLPAIGAIGTPTGASGPALPTGDGEPADCGNRTPHPPIRVTEDHGLHGFNWTNPATGESEHRPGSGVVAGNGSAENPYVISGWCVGPVPIWWWSPGYGRRSLLIKNTAAHVLVRDNYVQGTSTWVNGVKLENASHVAITNNTITHNRLGIDVARSNDTRLTHNTITDHLHFGIGVSESTYTRIANNTVQYSGRFGIFFDHSTEARVAHNTVTDNGFFGVYLFASTGAQVANNTISHNRDDGVHVRVSTGARIANNNIHSNTDAGLSILGDSEPLNATDNWWGHETGPGGGVTDACTGTVADGDGDEIDTSNGGEVCFDPWLSSPNPDAGAS